MKEDKSIRIFENNILHALSKTDFYSPIIFWVLVMSVLIYRSITSYDNPWIYNIIALIGGVIGWTLMEYVIHKYIFHPLFNHRWLNRLAYVSHGVHHIDPDDKARGLMPVVGAAMLGITFYTFFSFFISSNYLDIFYTAVIISYLFYDYSHYATHHIPLDIVILKKLKRHHAIHHINETVNFGLSSPLWDIIFKTYKK